MPKMTALLGTFAVIVAFAPLVASAHADQSDLAINTAIDGPFLKFDWPDIAIGVASYEAGPTGATVVRFAKRASIAVDVRGGAALPVNSDLLRLGYSFPIIDAVVFSGGSSYGEEAITAVQTGLKDDGVRSAKWNDIALVVGAIIYDFSPFRLNEIYPDKRLGQAALRASRPGIFPLGAQGAGRSALQGEFFGCLAHSGQGAAFRQVGQTKIAAFVVVNALGAITDRNGNLVKCNRAKSWGNLTKTSDLLLHLPESLQQPDWNAAAAEKQLAKPSHTHTTVSLIVTNEALDYAALLRLAVQVHTSIARAIQPFSTQDDGDTLFAASTQEIYNNPQINPDSSGLSPMLGAIAAEVMWDAILASVPEERAFAPPANVKVPSYVLAAYAGDYEFGPKARLSVKVEGSKVVVQSTGEHSVLEFDKPVAVLPASSTEFYVDSRYRTRIAFLKDSTGHVTGAVVNPGRWEQKGKRIDLAEKHKSIAPPSVSGSGP
jgi:L-aminopeptidase/D-esterase-like protein